MPVFIEPLARTVHLAGSTTLLARMQRAAEAFMHDHPDTGIVIPGAFGTARGYKAVMDRTADIAMASGALPEQLARTLDQRGLSLRYTMVGQLALVPLVHAVNPVSDLSLRQLRLIFTGRIRNWRDVGGRDGVIDVLGGPPTGGISSSWKAQVLGEDHSYTAAMRVLGTAERLASIATNPFAISFVGQMPLPDRRVKRVRVDALAAEPLLPSYPLRVPLMLVSLDSAPDLASRFIAYALRMQQSMADSGAAYE